MTDSYTKFSQFTEETTSPITFLVINVTGKVDRKGNDFCEIEASDGDQNVTLRLWKTSETASGLKSGDVIRAYVTSTEYNGSMSFSLQPDSYSHESPDRRGEFIRTPPVPADKMWAWITSEVDAMRPSLRWICGRLIVDQKEAFLSSSAAKSIHHAFIGGLAYHSYRMARNAASIAEIYGADRQMCVAGALLHDIGKLREMSTDRLGHAEYTIEGQLKGHLLIGCQMVEEAASQMPENIKEMAGDDIPCLEHVIASHHGKQEMGAIRKPMTREAYIVSECDMLDMNLTICEEESSLVMPGNMSTQDNFVVGKIYVPYTPNSEAKTGYDETIAWED